MGLKGLGAKMFECTFINFLHEDVSGGAVASSVALSEAVAPLTVGSSVATRSAVGSPVVGTFPMTPSMALTPVVTSLFFVSLLVTSLVVASLIDERAGSTRSLAKSSFKLTIKDPLAVRFDVGSDLVDEVIAAFLGRPRGFLAAVPAVASASAGCLLRFGRFVGSEDEGPLLARVPYRLLFSGTVDAKVTPSPGPT